MVPEELLGLAGVAKLGFPADVAGAAGACTHVDGGCDGRVESLRISCTVLKVVVIFSKNWRWTMSLSVWERMKLAFSWAALIQTTRSETTSEHRFRSSAVRIWDFSSAATAFC